MLRKPGSIVPAILVVVLLTEGDALAQRVTPSDLFRIEIFKPEFESADYALPTSALFLTLRQSVEGPVSVELKIPFGYVREDGLTGSDWEFRPGNPYIGLSWGSTEKPAELGFGLRAPILPNDAMVRIMQIADIHQFEAFTPDLWNFSVHSIVGGDSGAAQARSGLNLWIPLHGGVQLVSNYSLTLRRRLVNLLAGLQIRGRAGLTSGDVVYGERTMHEAGLILEFPTAKVRPGFVIRTPIQGREVVDWVFGVTLDFE